MMMYFSPEQVEEYLRKGSWKTLRADDRVLLNNNEGGSTNMSIHSFLRRYGGRYQKEARQLWDTIHPR
jgi:hypothetical protein